MASKITANTVDGYIKKLPEEHQKIARRLMSVVKKAAPKSKAVIKYGMPTFEQDGIFSYIQKSKKYLSFGFYNGIQLSDPKGQFEGSGVKLRHIKLITTKDIPTTQLEKWIKQAVRINQRNTKNNK